MLEEIWFDVFVKLWGFFMLFYIFLCCNFVFVWIVVVNLIKMILSILNKLNLFVLKLFRIN